MTSSAIAGLPRFAVAAPTPLAVFGLLLLAAAGVNAVDPLPLYWPVAGVAGLAVVVVLERRAERRVGPRGRLLASALFSATLLAAVRVTAEITGSIVVADTVLGIVLLLQGLLLRARGLVVGGAACAALSLTAGALVEGPGADVAVSLTSGAALLAAA